MIPTQSNRLLIIAVITITILGASAYAQQPVKIPVPAEVRSEKTSPNTLFDFGLPATRDTQPQGGSGLEKSQSANIVHTESSAFGVPTKQRGVIRIGLVSAASDAPEDQKQATIAKMGILINGVPGASPFDSVILTSMLKYQITAEARAKDCDFILSLDTKSQIRAKKAGGGILGNLIRVGSDLVATATSIPGISSAGRVVNTANQAANSAERIDRMLNGISKLTKKGNSVTLTYGLASVGGTQVIGDTTETLKATKDGEPILQNLLINIGNKVLAAIPQAK